MKDTQIITVDFFKPSGKWYTGCKVEVPLYLSDSGYAQAIVDGQRALHEGWQNSDWIVVTSAREDPDYEGFHEKVWLPFSFKGIKKGEPSDENSGI